MMRSAAAATACLLLAAATGSQRFDVVATIPEGVPMSQVPAMLRTLLEERFQRTTSTRFGCDPR